MEQISEIVETKKIPVTIKIPAYIRDHKIGGRVILPAVESCRLLAEKIKDIVPDIQTSFLYDASFDRFVEIPQDADEIEAIIEFSILKNDEVVTRLLTRIQRAGITRSIEHVVVKFKKGPDYPPFKGIPVDVAACLEGVGFQIDSKIIYKDLIAFGPAYQNVTDVLSITREGVVANVQSSDISSANGALGSPFPFDAALQAACIWGQRYHGIVAFPIGFDKRFIINPTTKGQKYFARIIPGEVDGKILKFDVWIFDFNGILFEVAFGVRLKDVSAGKVQPPEWIIDDKSGPLEEILKQCEELTVIELDYTAPFSDKSFSEAEMERYKSMGHKRIRSYTGARLACKRLSRKLAGNDMSTPGDTFTTFTNDVYPVCPMPDGTKPFNCSVSHDDRFAFAAASKKRIGVDVETISREALLSKKFVNKHEIEAVSKFTLGDQEALARIWTIKEAVTKALDLKFAATWESVEVFEIGEKVSRLRTGGDELKAYHDTIDGHLFTLIVIE